MKITNHRDFGLGDQGRKSFSTGARSDHARGSYWRPAPLRLGREMIHDRQMTTAMRTAVLRIVSRYPIDRPFPGRPMLSPKRMTNHGRTRTIRV